MGDDIVTRLHQWRRYNDGEMLTSPSGELSLTLAAAINEIERLEDAVSELRMAFQELTDQGDACPLCWDIFKKSGLAVNCYGHATIAELEARRD